LKISICVVEEKFMELLDNSSNDDRITLSVVHIQSPLEKPGRKIGFSCFVFDYMI
jgi:hypothetical protein